MKKLFIIALAIIILAAAFQATQTAAAAQNDSPIFSWLTPENARGAPSAQQFALAARGIDVTGAWDILLFYNDGGKDREIWYLSQQGTTITGHSRYINDRGDFVRNRMTGILNGSYLTMTIKSGLDTVTEFKARIENNGTTMGTDSTSPSGTTFQQTMTSIKRRTLHQLGRETGPLDQFEWPVVGAEAAVNGHDGRREALCTELPVSLLYRKHPVPLLLYRDYPDEQTLQGHRDHPDEQTQLPIHRNHHAGVYTGPGSHRRLGHPSLLR
jgi:hypothetical protein